MYTSPLPLPTQLGTLFLHPSLHRARVHPENKGSVTSPSHVGLYQGLHERGPRLSDAVSQGLEQYLAQSRCSIKYRLNVPAPWCLRRSGHRWEPVDRGA